MTGLQFTWLKKGPRGDGIAPLLAVSNLCVRVGIRRVLDGVHLEIYEGDHVRITGPNGSGKSTLLNAIAGVPPARYESGVIKLKGADIMFWPSHERVRAGIAYMRQRDNVFPGLSVAENLTLSLGADGPRRFREKFPEWSCDMPPDKLAGALSGGQKQKLAWAMTVLKDNSRLLLLDEPTAGVSDEKMEVSGTYLVVEHD